jgi:CCR4-NOT transcription complex subunit 7/8
VAARQDTEFPGVVARPIGSFASHTDYQYQTLRCNVDLLKIIQLGLTFSDKDGNLVEGCPTWQFNFKFNLCEDMYAQDSIDLLTRSGIAFKNHEERGIDISVFGELLTSSGMRRCCRWRCDRLPCDRAVALPVLQASC